MMYAFCPSVFGEAFPPCQRRLSRLKLFCDLEEGPKYKHREPEKRGVVLYVTSGSLMAISILRRSGDGTRAQRGNFCVQFTSTPRYLNLRHGPHLPFPSPSQECPPQSPPLSVFYLSLQLARPSLTLLQNTDVEKDAIAHHQNGSQPESERSLGVLSLSTKLQNPLAGKDKGTLEADAVSFCEKHGLMEHGTATSLGFSCPR